MATGRCDTEKFTSDVNAAGLCGAIDWRMPQVKELEGIVDFGRGSPAIDPTYFPNTTRYVYTTDFNYWSGSHYVDGSNYYANYAWRVNFNYGDASDLYRGHLAIVRLVRGGQ